MFSLNRSRFRNLRLWAIAYGAITAAASLAATPVGTAFTYQGQLNSNNTPADGTFAMTFALFDAASGGNLAGPTLTFDGGGGHPAPINVTDGLFTAQLDFGPGVFMGSARWLEVTVNGVTLTPRQLLAPTPNAVYAENVPWTGVLNAPAALPPNGPAGGDLTGSYPNPNIAANAVGNAELAFDPISLSKVSNNALYTNGAFVGLGTSTPVGSANFVVSQPTSLFGGMYVNTTSATGWPFYGYSQNNGVTAYHFIDGADANKWKLVFGTTTRLTVTTSGHVGIGTTTPAEMLAVTNNNGDGMHVIANSSQYSPTGIIVEAAGGDYAEGIISSGGYIGVHGSTTALLPYSSGVSGDTNAPNSYGVHGYALDATGTGVWGVNFYGNGVVGEASNSGKAIVGLADSASAYAGYFSGKVQVTGTLSKGAGSFKIDHPLDPQNMYLYHSFVESPDMMNIYNGNATTDADGNAEITLPDWFDALNRDFRYQLTVLDDARFAQARVSRKINGNRFAIKTDQPNIEVSWQVTGIRHDAFAEAHRIPVEEAKEGAERGHYLHPIENGAPAELGIEAAHRSPQDAAAGNRS